MDCHIESLKFLNSLTASGSRIAVDDSHLVFGEYFRLMSEQLAPYSILTRLLAQGRVLYRHIDVVNKIAVIPDEIERIVDDKSDRKFVAISLTFLPPTRPPIVNATDSDWRDWEKALAGYDVEVIQLCPGLSSRS